MRKISIGNGRWLFAVFALLLVVSALWGVIQSWSQISETFNSGLWGTRAFLFVLMFFCTLGLAVWCLKLSEFHFERIMDIFSVVGVLFICVVAVYLIKAEPAAMNFNSFLLMTSILFGAQIGLKKLLVNHKSFLPLVLVFPVASFVCIATLYMYVYEPKKLEATEWIPYVCQTPEIGELIDPSVHLQKEIKIVAVGDKEETFTYEKTCGNRQLQFLDSWRVAGYLFLIFLSFYFSLTYKPYFDNQRESSEANA